MSRSRTTADDLWRGVDRRRFLKRAAWLLPALHYGMTARPMSAFDTTAKVDFRELILRTHRPHELARFYRELLELPVEVGKEVVVTAGTTNLVFLPADPETEPFYHFAFTIPENKLGAAIDWMSSRAPLLDRGRGPVVHFEALDAHSVYFYDPAGNIVEFIAHHRLDNGGTGPFDAGDILYASEIGLVVPRVDAMAETLERKLGLGVYVRSYGTFAPIGDIHGLFIVVETDRVWLMTDKNGQVFPTEVGLGSPRREDLVIPGLPYRIRSTS